jgi:gamma-D-glutamyl-L-lysine dipeptidyl-peptidase
MQYGLCTLSIVPARKEPAGTSEMVTQLLFGETYTVKESIGGWIRIRITFDNYECWISEKQHTRINEQTYQSLQRQEPSLVNELVQLLHDKKNNHTFPVTLGATLPFYRNHTCQAGEKELMYEGQISEAKIAGGADEILQTAFLFLNAPYLWGGKSPFGIDCSGFTQLCYKLNGHKLPRDSEQQVELGTPLSFVDEALAGDLAFFDNEEGKIVHVGILLDNQKIIHASGFVRVDKFDHYGIYNTDKKGYSHHLRVIKRII